MRRLLWILAATTGVSGCISNNDDAKPRTSSAFSITAQPVVTITHIGVDTLSDSARIHWLEPEPDGKSIAFLFADPAKGVTSGLGIIQTSNQSIQLGWPDSVVSVWWSNPHQLSFTAGTGRGIRVVVDAHAAELSAINAAATPTPTTHKAEPSPRGIHAGALSRAKAFIDSVRVQPEGSPQGSALRYQADSIVMAPGDTLAAIHVVATDVQGTRVNPTWYLMHLPSGSVKPVDSLTGRSPDLPASAGEWGADGSFYYAKGRSIWRAAPSVR